MFACRGKNMFEYDEASVQTTTRSKLPVSVEPKVQNHHKRFKKKIVQRKQCRIWKKYHIWKRLSENFNNLPNDIHSEKSFSAFKDKS